MKKLFLTLGIFSCVIFYAQESKSFYEISYNSICCGPPSTDPVMNYIERFQSKNKTKPIDVFQKSGLGREGEFVLFIETDAISKMKRKNFVKGLKTVIDAQNKSRKQKRDGFVNLKNTETLKKEEFNKENNIKIFKKEKEND